MPQKLSDIKALLAGFGLRPKHRHGQNFLHDAGKMAQIIQAAAISPGDLILEIGPGTGSLSVHLLDAGAELVAVEIDLDLEPILDQVFMPYSDHAKLLMFDILASKHQINPQVLEVLGDRRFTLIANLPYNVASPLIANLVVDHPNMTSAIVLIQREVADRFTASPGTKAYGPLGIMVQAMCHIKRLTTLTPGCFWPKPKVDSAVVYLTRREQPLTDNPQALAKMLHRLFTKRRKQLGAILGRDFTLPENVDFTMRPEQLTVEQLIELSAISDQLSADNG